MKKLNSSYSNLCRKMVLVATVSVLAFYQAYAQWDARGRTPVVSNQVDDPIGIPSMVVTGNDRIVTAFTPTKGRTDGMHIVITSHTANGEVDDTFGGNGKVDLALGDTLAYVKVIDLMVNTQGFYVLATSAPAFTPEAPRLMVLKLGTNGLPDATFGTTGLVIDNRITADSSLPMSFIHSDDEVVRIHAATQNKPLFYQVSPNGTVSPSLMPFAVSNNDVAYFATRNNTTTVVGYEVNRSAYSIHRYNSDGSHDQSFGANGVYTWNPSPVGGQHTILRSAVANDGTVRVLTAEQSVEESALSLTPIAYNATSSSSLATLSFVANTSQGEQLPLLEAMGVDSAQRVYLGGVGYVNGGFAALAFRIDTSLSLDESFGNNGRWTATEPALTSPSRFHHFVTLSGGTTVGLMSMVNVDTVVYYLQVMDPTLTSVSENENMGSKWSIRELNGNIQVHDVELGSTVVVANLLGQVQFSCVATSDVISLPTMPNGVVIVKTSCCGAKTVLIH